jgi:hypothetical protein
VALGVGFVALVLLALGWAVLTRRAIAEWTAMCLAAAWLPINNGNLEGNVVFVISRSQAHAITVSDLVGVGCWSIATVLLCARASRTAASADATSISPTTAVMLTALGCSAVLGLGVLAAYLSG